MNWDDLPDRLVELLIMEATEGLDRNSRDELARLLADHPDLERDEVMRAAALAELGFMVRSDRPIERMPDTFKQRLKNDARRHFAKAKPGAEAQTRVPAERRPRWNSWQAGGWYAAAAVLIAAIAVWPRQPDFVTGASPLTAQSVAEHYERLLEEPDTQRLAWTPSEESGFEQVTGEVIWNNTTQEGYMVLSSLPVNDPTVEQYQLWIVDPERDERPVDGGVFDVFRTDGAAIIPIRAKLDVIKPAAFAITLEKPGGVVVSDGPLLVVAPVA